jgi:hypothetical protein
MSLFLKQFGFYPQLCMSPADDDGSGGGGSGGDDGDADKGGDYQGGSGDDGGDKKGGLIDKDKIMGKGEGDKDPDPDADKDKGKKAERPEHIPEKFWDPEKGEIRHEAMAKAYQDLEKKLGNNKKAPDDYKIELDDDLKKLFQADKVESDPMLKWFKDYAKSNNFTQEMFNDALKGFGKTAGDFLKGEGAPPPMPDAKEELGKLGKNGQAIVDNQVEFLSGLFKRGELNEGQMQEILILTETAAGIQALQAIRKHYGEAQNIPLDLKADGGVKSADELRTMQADKRYGADKEYTDMVDKEYERKYGNGKSGESQRSPLY